MGNSFLASFVINYHRFFILVQGGRVGEGAGLVYTRGHGEAARGDDGKFRIKMPMYIGLMQVRRSNG